MEIRTGTGEKLHQHEEYRQGGFKSSQEDKRAQNTNTTQLLSSNEEPHIVFISSHGLFIVFIPHKNFNVDIMIIKACIVILLSQFCR